MSKRENVYNKRKIKDLLYIITGFIFILWNENYHISLVVSAIYEISIFIPLDKNKCSIYRKSWISSIYNELHSNL
jgi:hypothetical protein